MTNRRAAGAAFCLFLVLAVVVSWPLALHMGSTAVGHIEQEATPPLNTWAMAVVLHQLAHDPVHLFDGNAFYPYARSLAFSEHLFVPALLGAPVALATGNLTLAYNVVTLLTFAIGGLGAYLLAAELFGSRAAGVLAGVVYAFNTWNVNEIVRLQILSNEFFPWVLLALLRYFAAPTWRRAALVALAYALQSLSCMYFALYLPLLVAPTVAWLWWRRRAPFGVLTRLATAALPAILLTALFAIPYIRSARELGFIRSVPESVGIDRYFDVLPGNLFYEGWLGIAGPNQNAGHFLGFLVMGLSILGIWRGPWPREHPGVRALLAVLAVAGFTLSLGPEIKLYDRVLMPGPYTLFFEHVPGFRNVRYPERFAVFLALAIAPLAAAGFAALQTMLGRAKWALVALVFLEHLALPNLLTPMPSGESIPDVYPWVAGQPDVRVTAEWPASRYFMERLDALPMYYSTVHWRRTLEGFTSYFPPTYNFAKWRLFHFPDAESVAFLERFGVDTVLVSPQDGRLPEWFVDDPRWTRVGPLPDGGGALRLRQAGKNPYVAPAATAPDLVEVPRTAWRVQGSQPGAGFAIDGDVRTSWSTRIAQTKRDFFRIRFPQAVGVARISLPVRGRYDFPMRVKLTGQLGEETFDLPCDVGRAYDRLFAFLLHDPAEASLDFDLEGRPVDGVRISIAENDAFTMPWTLTELHVYRRR